MVPNRDNIIRLNPYLYTKGFLIPGLLSEGRETETFCILVQSLTEEELAKMSGWFQDPIRAHVLILMALTPELREVLQPITINKRTIIEIKAFFDRTIELSEEGKQPVAMVTPDFLRAMIGNFDSRFFQLDLAPAKDPFGKEPLSLASIIINGVACIVTGRDTEFAAMSISPLGTVITTKEYVTLIRADLREMKKRRDKAEQQRQRMQKLLESGS